MASIVVGELRADGHPVSAIRPADPDLLEDLVRLGGDAGGVIDVDIVRSADARRASELDK